MSVSARWFAVAALLVLPADAQSQEAVRIDPKEAMQCAVWASMVSEEVGDADTQAAVNAAMGYFVGQYEGATGRSVIEGHDEAVIREVALDPDICWGHVQRYSPRWVEWDRMLRELGDRLANEQAAKGGQ